MEAYRILRTRAFFTPRAEGWVEDRSEQHWQRVAEESSLLLYVSPANSGNFVARSAGLEPAAF
jgi:hypothetical protein